MEFLKHMDLSPISMEFLINLLVFLICLPCGWLAAACCVAAGRLEPRVNLC